MTHNTPVLTRWTYTLTDATGKDYSFDELMVVSQAAVLAANSRKDELLLNAFNNKSPSKSAFQAQRMGNRWVSIFDIQAREVSDEDRDFVEQELA